MATDLGSETNGFWFLGQEILPSKVDEQEVYGTALGFSWLEGAGVCGEPFSSAWPLFISGNVTSHPRTQQAPA